MGISFATIGKYGEIDLTAENAKSDIEGRGRPCVKKATQETPEKDLLPARVYAYRIGGIDTATGAHA